VKNTVDKAVFSAFLMKQKSFNFNRFITSCRWEYYRENRISQINKKTREFIVAWAPKERRLYRL